MIHLEEIKFKSLILHKIGSKANNEGVNFSKSAMQTSEDINQLLLHYFFTPFKHREYYHLTHDSDINLNEIYSYASAIFENPSTIFEQSINIAKHLYQTSTHPKIKPGELYIVFFQDCIVEGELVDAIGIFKSENKDTFLKVYSAGGDFGLESDNGININKLDKGCLIFNSMKEFGYLVAAVDNLSKNNEAIFWMNDFLNLKRREDEYFQTEAALEMCKTFVSERMPEEFEVCKAEQAEYLQNSSKFFKEKENFSMKEFEQEVFKSPEVIDSFRSFKEKYENEGGKRISSDFEIANDAVKKQGRILKSIIRLDKNFQINVMGNTELIKKGYDREQGMHYYTLFYNEEF